MRETDCIDHFFLSSLYSIMSHTIHSSHSSCLYHLLNMACFLFLSFHPLDPLEMEYEEAVSKVTLQQVIRDLEPSTSYTFYVKAYTSHGASKPSDSIAESTHGEGESGPCLAFTQNFCHFKD